MSTKSIHLETLEKIQHMLDGFDMSFRLSNKVFRLAIVSEIIDATCLFEQLYQSWSERLPFGEGPDCDIDFAYWQNIDTWNELRTNAQQNLCIVSAGIDFGNGTYSEDTDWVKCRKAFPRLLKEVVKSARLSNKDVLTGFSKLMDSDDFDITSFGNLVFYSLSKLTGVLRKIQLLLETPPDSLMNMYCSNQRERFIESLEQERKKMADILEEDLSDRRKHNRLKSFCANLQRSLFDSGFVDDLVGRVTDYDVEDYRAEHPEVDSDDVFIKRIIALSELLEDDGSLRPKANKYLFEHRKQLDSNAVKGFFMYIDLKPALDRMISTFSLSNDGTSLPVEVVSQVKQLTKQLQSTPANVSININVIKGDQVMHKDANIDKNFGPVICSE